MLAQDQGNSISSYILTGDLGVELDAVDGLSLVCDSGVLRVLSCADGVETFGKVAELVTVRHPHGHGILETLEELVDMATEASGLQVSVTVLASGTSNDVVSVQTVGDLLETVANSENGDAQLEEGGVDVGGILLIHRVGTTGQNDSLGAPAEIGQLLGAG